MTDQTKDMLVITRVRVKAENVVPGLVPFDSREAALLAAPEVSLAVREVLRKSDAALIAYATEVQMPGDGPDVPGAILVLRRIANNWDMRHNPGPAILRARELLGEPLSPRALAPVADGKPEAAQ